MASVELGLNGAKWLNSSEMEEEVEKAGGGGKWPAKKDASGTVRGIKRLGATADVD